jgi:nucleoside-diphosphate kinase
VAIQKTLILFKPDCVQRRLVGQILHRFETKGFRIVGMKLVQVGRDLGAQHYAEHEGKPFYDGLIQFITKGPVVAAILEGPEAVPVVRKLIGKTNGLEAEPGTIRGDFSASKQNNLIHGSDSPESAAREIGLWFTPEEIAAYSIPGDGWISEEF